jgi:hypothetical protein
MTRTRAALICLLAAGGLSGCASVYLVDNQVQSFARWSEAAPSVPAAPQTYRFERLPSQMSNEPAQATLERLSAEALASVGWTPATEGSAAPWRVQVSASTVTLPRAPWESPPSPFRRADRVVTADGKDLYMPMPMFMEIQSPFYQRKVSLVIRDAASGRVVYETQAAHDGRWGGSEPLWGAMLNAALQGFPQAPDGPRQVNIDVPR